MLTETQKAELERLWNDKIDELLERGHNHPGKLTFDVSTAGMTLDAALVNYRIAIDSTLTIERANLTREYGWLVEWVDPANLDVYETIESLVGMMLTRRK